ncbi:MAG: hypothetical protein NTW66_02685 [Candidatus Magasanikbacteria bacterium]|nr:hypothetical protein [Candidatus Magasanikbacteria bacterium]
MQKKISKNNEDILNTVEPLKAGEYIEYGNPQYQFSIKYIASLISDFSSPESKLILGFPESFTTGTNLGTAQIRLDINKRTCANFSSGEDQAVGWHYTKTTAIGTDFPEKITVNGAEFRRLKCSDAAMSHVADSLIYITEKDSNAFSLNLYLLSANPEVYDESIRPLTYDPAGMEKIFLQVLSSFKFKE